MRSEEIRKKISESCRKRGVGKWRKGKPSWNRGKSWTPEIKAKISRTLIGRKMPQVSIANSKRKYSKETRMLRSRVMKETWKDESFRKKQLESVSGSKCHFYISDRTKLKKSDEKKYDSLYKESEVSTGTR